MAVNKPDNDKTLRKVAVKTMHDDVRDVVNDLPLSSLGRNGLNSEHLPGVICAYDYGSYALDLTINYNKGRFQQEDPSTFATDWHCYHKATGDNTKWVLGNNGSGYSLPPCKVIAFANIRVAQVVQHGSPFDDTQSTDRPHPHYSSSWMLFASLGYEDVSGEHFSLADTGCVRALDTNTYHGHGAYTFHTDYPSGIAHINTPMQFNTGYRERPQIVEQAMSIWTVIDKSEEPSNWTLTSIHPRFATFEGQDHKGDNFTAPLAGTGDPPKWLITSGSLGFFALRS